MKQSMLLFLCILGTLQLSFAQEEDTFIKNATTFGVKTGLDHTFVLNTFETENTTNWYAGLFAETRLSKRIGIQYELRYSLYDTTDFIETPILFKYYFNDKFNAFIGPRFDFLLGGNTAVQNFSVAAEIGLQYQVSKRFFIEGSYSISSENQINLSNFNTGNRNSLRFGIGYKF